MPFSDKTNELTEGAIETEVALDVCQIRVSDCPSTTLFALPENVTVGAAGFTVIVTDCDAVPPAPAAVIV